MASANTRRANAAKRNTTRAVANTKATNAATNATVKRGRGRPTTDDVLVRVNPAQLAFLQMAANAAIVGAPAMPEIPADPTPENLLAFRAEMAAWPDAVARANAENAIGNSAIVALSNAKAISRKAN